jgi:hypothetical protein
VSLGKTQVRPSSAALIDAAALSATAVETALDCRSHDASLDVVRGMMGLREGELTCESP